MSFFRSPPFTAQDAILPTAGLEIAFQERTDMVAGHEFERRLAQRVMAAGHDDQLVIDAPFAHMLQHLAREFRQKSRVISGVEKERTLVHLRKMVHVMDGAYAIPGGAETVKVDLALNAFADMTRREAGPDNI